jgi:hypothetical protein
MVVANIDSGSSGFQIAEKSSRSAVLQGIVGGQLSGASRLMPRLEQRFPSASGSECASAGTR